MSLIEISTGTEEYVRVAISATKSGVAYDPTGQTVEMSFVASGFGESVATAIWHTGVWTTESGVYYAMCLVGDTFTLSAGTYAVFVRITDDPEIPIKHAGYLRVR